MSRVLMIGAGGVATVAAFKIVQNQDVFTEFMIASRRKENATSWLRISTPRATRWIFRQLRWMPTTLSS